eukprot:1590546-Prymnesium_polylepis.1
MRRTTRRWFTSMAASWPAWLPLASTACSVSSARSTRRSMQSSSAPSTRPPHRRREAGQQARRTSPSLVLALRLAPRPRPTAWTRSP